MKYQEDGNLLSIGNDATLRLWDEDSGRELHRENFRSDGPVAISDKGYRLAVVLGRKVLVLDVRDNTRAEFHSEDAIPLSVAVSPNEQRVAISYVPSDIRQLSTQNKSIIQVHRISDGELLHSLDGPNVPGHKMKFNPDGTVLATGGLDRMISVFDIANQRVIAKLEGHIFPIQDFAFSPDGGRIGSIDMGGTAKVWDVNAKNEHATLRGHSAIGYSIRFSPNSRQTAVAVKRVQFISRF